VSEEEKFNEESSESESFDEAESDDDFNVKSTARQSIPRPSQKSKCKMIESHYHDA
jgi:hypothetical protein